MGRFSGGYTIVEVMIVIAITGLIFASAVLSFHGEQGRTGFSQTMQDAASKIQNWATEISAGNYAGSSNYSCDASTGTPVLSQPPSGISPTSQCIFLGRLFQIQPGSDTLKSNAVVGTRDAFNGNVDTNELATTVSQANPTPAVIGGGVGARAAFEEDFNLSNGATFLSSRDAAAGNERDTVGLYDNLQANSGSAGSAANNLLLCLSNSSGGCGATSGQWFLCVQGSNNQKAQLEVISTSSGVSTSLNFDSNCT